MGSLAAGEEDDAAKSHSRPPPSPSSQQRPLFPPFPPTLKTVINGTTWYHLPPVNLDSPVSPASPARYGLLPPLNSVNFDAPPSSHPSLDRHPHHTYPNNGGGAVGNGGIQPPVHVISGGYTSCYMPEYIHGLAPHGIFPGHPYPGMYGPMPGYPYNGQQNQGMPYYPYDGHGRPYLSSPPNALYMTMPFPTPGSMQGPAQAHHEGPARASHGVPMMHYTSHSMPPHAVRTKGRTSRQIVTWSGLTMPVTITSQAAAVMEWIQRQTGDLFGLDLEWKPNRFKDEDNSVALLQICGPTDCLIIQLLYTDMIPKMLREFLSNARKRLGGVGIRQDVVKLEKDHDLVCQGQVELGALASEKLQRGDLRGTGLKRLVDQVLGMTLVKVKKITMSNWEKEYLDEKQIEYACIDAWAAYAVLHKLMTL